MRRREKPTAPRGRLAARLSGPTRSRARGAGSFFVVVRGPLGIGKTTVAQTLAKALRGRWISVDEILEEFQLEEWKDGYISEASFLRTNEFVERQALPWLEAGTPVVVDGNFYWPSQVDDLTGRLPYPSRVFTLKGPVELCIARDAGRKLSYGEEGARAVFAKSTSFRRGISLDASRPLREIVAQIRSRLPTRKLAVVARPTSSTARGRRPRGSGSRRSRS
jgi:AAA domain-containing protein